MLIVFDLGKVYLNDVLYNHCRILLSKLVHLENKNFFVKFEYVFSDPECPLVFFVSEMLKAINIIIKARQGTLESFN